MTKHALAELLLEKLSSLPEDKLAEVIDFVDFLREKQARTGSTREERLRIAAAAGLVTLPKPGQQRSNAHELPPAAVPGKPASEMVIEDRR